EIFNSTITGNLSQAQRTSGVGLSTGATSPSSGSNARQPTLKVVSSIISNPAVSSADIGVDLATIDTPFLPDVSHSLVQNPGLGVSLPAAGNLVGIPPYL